ncbi:hypothetical protein F4802DRAFT_406400 [Xylaria palmicola]|nr:hypothetical protein F4802DRAFT_406400 [Xylaria palmicola]
MALGSATPDSSRLLSMPAEIRNIIYELVLIREWGITSQDFVVLDRPLPAFFRTNRQIRSEALDLFLLRNHIHVYTSWIGLKWLNILGTDVCRFRFLILFIDLNVEEWHKYLKALLPLVSRSLELRVRNAAASLSEAKFHCFLEDAGLYDGHRWTIEENGTNERIFRQIQG